MQPTTQEQGDVDTAEMISGIIVYKDRAYLVSTLETDLIMDCCAWALDLAQKREASAAIATTARARKTLAGQAHDLRRWAAGEVEEAESDTLLMSICPSLALRARLGFLQVRPSNFAKYMATLLKRVDRAKRNIHTRFMLMAFPERPEMYVTQTGDPLLRYVSPGVYTQVILPFEMNRFYLAVLDRFPRGRIARRKGETTHTPELELTDLVVRDFLFGMSAGIVFPMDDLEEADDVDGSEDLEEAGDLVGASDFEDTGPAPPG